MRVSVHILKASAPITLHDGSTLAAGEWLVQDDNAFQLALMTERGTCRLEGWLNHNYREQPEAEGPVKSILLIRSGAIGDLLLLSPCIEPLMKKYPGTQIWIGCFKRHWDIFAGLGHFIEYPIPVSELHNFDLIIPLENIVELSTEKGQHATDAFAEALGVTVEDYRPVYRVTEEEMIYCNAGLPKTKPRIALQLHASSVIRNYPLQQWNVVIKALLDRGWEIMLLGNQDGITGGPPALKDCSKLTFREAAAVLATCDVFCGVDSSFFNLCPALGVPAIGLFGPVDWKTRIKDMDAQRALTTPAPCAPCGWTNSRAGRRFPSNGPCAKSGRCEPLAAIPPERIVAKIDAYRK